MSVEYQYNGYVLLYGYLQRLFVSEKVKAMLSMEDYKEEKTESLKLLLNELGEIGTYFYINKSLTEEYKEFLLGLTDKVHNFAEEYKEQIKTADSLDDKIAVVASTLYAEEHINSGIIRMGEMFNPAIQDRYLQHLPYYRQRVGWVNSVVHKKVEGSDLSADDSSKINDLYMDITRCIDGIDKDFQSMKAYFNSDD